MWDALRLFGCTVKPKYSLQKRKMLVRSPFEASDSKGGFPVMTESLLLYRSCSDREIASNCHYN